MVRKGRLAGLGILAVAVIVWQIGVGIYIDWLWYRSLGYSQVFWTNIGTRWALISAATALIFLVWMANLIAIRANCRGVRDAVVAAPRGRARPLTVVEFEGIGELSLLPMITALGILAGVVVAVVMGLAAGGQWFTWLAAQQPSPFGVRDPLFNLDASFFVFTLPLWNAIQEWALVAILALLAGVATAYGAVASERETIWKQQGVLAHLFGLGAALAACIAWGHRLGAYGLVFSKFGVVQGAGYALANLTLPALNVATGAAVLVAIACAVSAVRRIPRLVELVGAGWLIIFLVGVQVLPWLTQKLSVEPAEFSREEPYLLRNIELTRQGFGLAAVQETAYAVRDVVRAQDVQASPESLKNVRLWDPRPLLATYNQVQTIRQYYTFEDVDVDRYTIDGQYRQVMLSARELDSSRLNSTAQTWVNQRLQFTHGYGLAMSYVDTVTPEGRPEFVVKDLPVAGSIPVERPQVYFGERVRPYVVVNTTAPEFDYPALGAGQGAEQNVYTHYSGTGGISVGSAGSRLAAAWYFGDLNLLLSGYLTAESRILHKTDVATRVHDLAPYLTLDPDPYLVVADQRLYFVQDAYTTSTNFPYSTLHDFGPAGVFGPAQVSYVRNSVKAVMDSYDGNVTFYVVDPTDPMAQTYARIYPGFYRPLSDLPESLRAHLRYPEMLFQVQADVLRNYHMVDPRVFYNREDAWDIAAEKIGDQTTQMTPYFILTQLPGEEKSEFVEIEPFTPSGKLNLNAWMAGRNDGENYGKLVLLHFPKDHQIDGPMQVEARIDQDPAISPQFSLWNQQGSKVIRGNTIIIPLNGALLYVESIFLQAEQSPLPELKEVVLVTADRVVMAPTFDQALAKLIGQPGLATGVAPASGAVPASAPATGGSDWMTLSRSAKAHFEQAQDAYKAGDWSRYGSELQGLQADLNQLAALAH